jgi:hypothetical protein
MSMPEIKPVVNKEPERDKKKAGFLSRLFGGGSGASAGLGGSGELGGLSWLGGEGGLGGLTSGGLLATKAGLMALILAGTTVAGGIGLIGYRLFGPGADPTGAGDNLQLFAPKPKAGQNGGQSTDAPKDGSSASLQYLNQANHPAEAAPDAAANAAPPGAAGAAAGSAAAAAGKGAGAANGAAGGNAPMPTMPKLGALPALPGGGGGGSAASASVVSSKPAGTSASSRGGLSDFKGNAAAKAGASSGRAISGFHAGGAVGQAFGALHDNGTSAQSSQSAGHTYDGAPTGGSNIGGNGTPIGGTGVPGANGASAQPQSLNGPTNTSNISPAPPGPPATDVCPWQESIHVAQGLLGMGALLLFVMSKVGKNPIAYYALNAAVAAIAAGVIVLGAKISGGAYGQTLQGSILMAAGAGLMVAAAMAGFMRGGASKTPTSVAGTAGATGTAGAAGAASSGSGFLGGLPAYMYLAGGAALLGIVGTMMMPPKTYPSTDFSNGIPPDGWFGYQQLPSERALKEMVA